MAKRLLTTTLLSMTLLSLNLSAGSKMKCNGSYCVVDLSNISVKNQAVKTQKVDPKKLVVNEVPMLNESYNILLIDNIETIVFAHEKYIMTEDERGEYELKKDLERLMIPVLSEEGLPSSEHFCEENLKPVKVAGLPNTFECA
jgi:hypothetical protein